MLLETSNYECSGSFSYCRLIVSETPSLCLGTTRDFDLWLVCLGAAFLDSMFADLWMYLLQAFMEGDTLNTEHEYTRFFRNVDKQNTKPVTQPYLHQTRILNKDNKENSNPPACSSFTTFRNISLSDTYSVIYASDGRKNTRRSSCNVPVLFRPKISVVVKIYWNSRT
jgi:hypothetical protein